jgi:hypothetical protein
MSTPQEIYAALEEAQQELDLLRVYCRNEMSVLDQRRLAQDMKARGYDAYEAKRIAILREGAPGPTSDAVELAHQATQVSSIYCYVAVSGDPSDPMDDDVPGVYEVEVQLPSPVDLAALTPVIETAIAKAVLDEFHENFGIAELDDFAIQVLLPNGTPVYEADLGESLETALEVSAFTVKADFQGVVEPSDLPFAYEAQAGPDNEDASPRPEGGG